MHQQYKVIKEIESAYDQLFEEVQHLVDVYGRYGGDAWALHSPTPSLEWLRAALLDFWYEDGQDGRATRTYIGLIAAMPPVLAQLALANIAKTRLATAIAEIKAIDDRLMPSIKATLSARHPAVNEPMRETGLARLHLKQCWRHIPYAEQQLERVRFAWYTSGRSIKKVTVQEAVTMLMAMDTEAPHIQIQLRALAGIPSSEPLAQVQSQSPVMRANLFYKEPLPDGRIRRAMNVPLPLFVPSEDGRLVHHNQPPPFPSDSRTRAIRSDEKLESHPFISTLRLFRYKSLRSCEH